MLGKCVLGFCSWFGREAQIWDQIVESIFMLLDAEAKAKGPPEVQEEPDETIGSGYTQPIPAI